MPEMPGIISIEKTLNAVDAEIEKIENSQDSRGYLGFSSIGLSCNRRLWYSFRWCSKKQFTAQQIKRFQDGHVGEDIQAERLRLVKGIKLYTVDPRTKEQFGFKDLGGHFSGHMDGVIIGLLESPKKYHVWEHKQTDEKKQKNLAKLKSENPDSALFLWDQVYYAQAILYMHYSEMKRHYLTCASAGGRYTISVRTKENKKAALSLINKAKMIIQSPQPMTRINNSPSWYECKMCDHHSICHTGAIPEVNCRTCIHSTPLLTGDNAKWYCEKYKTDLSPKVQRNGIKCPNHLYIPGLLPFEVTDANPKELWVEYISSAGQTLRNGNNGSEYKSKEIKAAENSIKILFDKEANELRSHFDAELVDSK